ncbi:hypothetical protein FDUTEX481_09263 [Tolypothrix sp. PCC 7601]|nr:hypothetical protein FDUTEX481_09263 [Tolypothrix sp. PCC 7601]
MVFFLSPFTFCLCPPIAYLVRSPDRLIAWRFSSAMLGYLYSNVCFLKGKSLWFSYSHPLSQR